MRKPIREPADGFSRQDALDICWKRLAMRTHSEQELRVILARKRIPDAVIKPVILRLKELGYVNDEAFAGQLIRRLQDSGHGPLKIRAELARRGLRSLSESDAGDKSSRVSQDAVNRLARQRYERMRALPERTAAVRLTSFLARRGFTPDTVRSAVRRVMEGHHPADLEIPDDE